MTETQEEIVEALKKASLEVHDKGGRGTAELVLVSGRVWQHLEPLLEDGKLRNQVHVMSPQEWRTRVPPPCDIKAIYHRGLAKIQQADMGGLELSVADEELPNIEVKLTLDDEVFENDSC